MRFGLKFSTIMYMVFHKKPSACVIYLLNVSRVGQLQQKFKQMCFV